MEKLTALTNFDVPKDEFMQVLVALPSVELAYVRAGLFEEAREKHLTHPTDVLVSRRESALCPVTFTHVEDIWSLASSISNSRPIPRILVNNGKRSKKNLEMWRNSSRCLSIVEKSLVLPESQKTPLSWLPHSPGTPKVPGDNSLSSSCTPPSTKAHTTPGSAPREAVHPNYHLQAR